MWDVVIVDPGNGRAGLHSDALRNEGVMVDFYLRIRSPCAEAAGNAAERAATASAVAIRTLLDNVVMIRMSSESARGSL